MRRVEREAIAAYRWRHVFITNGLRPEVGDTCFHIAEDNDWPWVKVTRRRKYASITVDMISAGRPWVLDAEAFERCCRIVDREGQPGTGLIGGPGGFWVESVPIHRAGNVAELLFAIASETGRA